MNQRGAVSLDRHLVRDTLQQSEDTGELVVTRIGIPDILGFHRDGSPVWGIQGGGEGYHNVQIEPISADQGPITLATTQKALWPYAASLLPANFFANVGKTIHIKAFGKATTDGTAGNYVAGIGYGSADAPTALAAGATVAGSISQTNISWILDMYCTSRLAGASGTLVGWGIWTAAVALLASTLQPYLLPASALAAVVVDLTASTNSPVFTLQRSSTGVWTATTQAIVFSAMN
jgi:hypothetical protein